MRAKVKFEKIKVKKIGGQHLDDYFHKKSFTCVLDAQQTILYSAEVIACLARKTYEKKENTKVDAAKKKFWF